MHGGGALPSLPIDATRLCLETPDTDRYTSERQANYKIHDTCQVRAIRVLPSTSQRGADPAPACQVWVSQSYDYIPDGDVGTPLPLPRRKRERERERERCSSACVSYAREKLAAEGIVPSLPSRPIRILDMISMIWGPPSIMFFALALLVALANGQPPVSSDVYPIPTPIFG